MNLNCLLIYEYFFLFRQLEAKLEQSSTELERTKTVLRQKEEDAQKNQQELKALKDALLEMEKRLEDQELEVVSSRWSVCDMEEQMVFATHKVEDFQATNRQQEGELARLREVLRRTEKELDERVAHLEQRYLFSEEERSMCINLSLHPNIMVQSKSDCPVLGSRQDSKRGPEESGRVKSRTGFTTRGQTR